jgi:hypothetical protein
MRFDWPKVAPSSLLLMVIHAVLLFVVLVYNCTSALCLMINVYAFVVIESIAVAFQGLLHYFTRKIKWRPITKILSFHVPVLIVFILSLVPSTGKQRENQRSPATSPNGLYILEVPIENRLWTVKIFDQQHRLLYTDQDSDFLGRFNSYWHWDKNNRVWMYNSDNGEIDYWESQVGKWQKQKWDRQDKTLAPPREMYPDYALPKK